MLNRTVDCSAPVQTNDFRRRTGNTLQVTGHIVGLRFTQLFFASLAVLCVFALRMREEFSTQRRNGPQSSQRFTPLSSPILERRPLPVYSKPHGVLLHRGEQCLCRTSNSPTRRPNARQ